MDVSELGPPPAATISSELVETLTGLIWNRQPLWVTLTAKLDLLRLPVPESNQLLSTLITVAFQADRNLAAVTEIVTFWAASNPEEDHIPIAALPLGWPQMTVPILQFYLQHDSSRGFYEWVYAIRYWYQDQQMDLACQNLDAIYGPQTVGVYQRVLRLGVPKQRGWVEGWLARYSDNFAPVPSWIIPVEGDPIPTHTQLLQDALALYPTKVEQAVQALPSLTQLEAGGEYTTAAREGWADPARLALRSTQAPPAGSLDGLQQKILTSLVEAKLAADQNLFRLFGPSWNSGVGSDWLDTTDPNNPCLWFGGHRLLLCVDSEAVDSEGEDICLTEAELRHFPWFTGKCAFCYRKIRALHHAFRLPLTDGGWLGTYCSDDCARQVTTDPDQLELIDRFAAQLREVGIYDRGYSRQEEVGHPPAPTLVIPFQNLQLGSPDRSWRDSESDREEEIGPDVEEVDSLGDNTTESGEDEDFGL